MNLFTITKIEHEEDKWIYHTSRGVFFLPDDDVGKVSKVDYKLAEFVNAGNPIVKHFVTSLLEDSRQIVEAANMCVDVVPYRNEQIYLIERKDGKGKAIPGGFIDEGEATREAAVRELQEETLVERDQYDLYFLGNKVRGIDSREINTWTFPFIARIHDGVMLSYDDDAISGQWYDVNSLKSMTLAFLHHKEIIELAICVWDIVVERHSLNPESQVKGPCDSRPEWARDKEIESHAKLKELLESLAIRSESTCVCQDLREAAEEILYKKE
jgi:ADP-ribose pyrophosphatase YjhB (NUDIX family)